MLRATTFGPVTRFDLARTIAGRGRYWTTCYTVDGLLVDSGCAHTARELADALSGAPLASIFNTHSHEDHIGANAILQDERRLPIRAHPLALPVLADPRGRQPLQPYRRVMWGYPQPSAGEPVGEGAWLETQHYRFQAIYTPGHSADHLCLYEPEQGWLFSGDLFVGGRDRALRIDYDIWGIIDSLKRIAGLPLCWLFPGSARVREDPAGDIADKIAYLEELGERIVALHRQGRSIDSIARAVCGKPMPIELITLGHFSRKGLVRSYLGMQQSPQGIHPAHSHALEGTPQSDVS